MAGGLDSFDGNGPVLVHGPDNFVSVGSTQQASAKTKVFLVSLFAGIVCAAAALAAENFEIIGMAFSEIDDDARKVIQHRFPRAFDLGDITKLDLGRLKAVLRDHLG